MPRRLIASLIVVGLAVLVSVFVARCKPQHEPAKAAGSASGAVASASGAVVTSPSPAQPPPETRVRRLSAAEHQQLAERIAAARARARQAEATQATPSPALPGSDDDVIRIEQVSATVRKALDDSIPILGECFHDKQPDQIAVVLMTMYSDPSVGMVIDTAEMTDEDGNPLSRELDDCLRTTIESLGLPPLDVGGHLPVQYSYRGPTAANR